MKKRLLSVAVLVFTVSTTYAQVGIGTKTPNESAQLEVISPNKGVLLPRLRLDSTTDNRAIEGGNVNSLLVFNTNEVMGEGYYYWMVDKWLKVINSTDVESFVGANNINDALTVNNVNHTLVLEDSEGHVVSVLLSDIFRDQEFVNAITVTHVDEIFNNETVIQTIIENLKGKYGNVIYNTDTNKFAYYDENYNLVEIDWSVFDTTNETFEVVGANLVITDTAGHPVSVALQDIFNHPDLVTAITVTHVDEIFNHETVIQTIIENLKGKYGNVIYNTTTNKFAYYDENYNLVEIDWSVFDTTNETFEVVGANLVITDTAGHPVSVALQDIFNHPDLVTAITVTHVDEIFNNETVIQTIIENLKGKYGNVVYNTTTNKFSYYDENYNLVEIDWSVFDTTNETFEVEGANLVITDTAGLALAVPLVDIFNHPDLVTAITVTHVDEIFNNETVIQTIIENLKGKYGNVIYNTETNKFEYLDDNFNVVEIDWTAFNTVNESLQIIGDELLLEDSDGRVLKVQLADIARQPWQVQGGTAPATLNTENIYQIGTVAVGATVIPSLTVGSIVQQVQFHVQGNISTSGKIYTTNSVYADYVFEKYFNGYSDLNKNYEFKSLDYIKTFVAANNHLPGVTKISDLNKTSNGYSFDMTELSVQQLEKIEELYLHTIEQQDLIEKQESEITQLKTDFDHLKAKIIYLESLILKSAK